MVKMELKVTICKKSASRKLKTFLLNFRSSSNYKILTIQKVTQSPKG